MRIVSLSAAGTEIVCALGGGEWLVGRSHECDNPPWVTKLPACTAPAFDVQCTSREIDTEVRRRLQAGEPLYHIGAERIRSLAPDVLIAQAHCEVCAPTPENVTQSNAATAAQRIVPLDAGSLGGIFADVMRLAESLGRPAAGQELVASLKQRLDRVREAVAERRRVSVVALEWTDPLFTMGNWGPELVEIAGGVPLLASPGEYSHAVEWSEIQAADPDVLLVAPCGFDLPRTIRERPVLESLPGWSDLRAVRERRAYFADGNRYFNRSGTTIANTAEILADMLHGTQLHAATNAWQKC